MKLGTEDRKKTLALGALLLIAGYFFYSNVLADSTPSPAPSRRPGAAAQRNQDVDVATGPVLPQAPAAGDSAMSPSPPRTSATRRNAKNDEFHPVLRKKGRPDEQQVRIEDIDPVIHTELLAKVQGIKVEGGQRNLFQYGPAPSELKGNEPKVDLTPVARVYDYPRPKPPDPPPPGPAPPPPLAPPSFKYYGLATKRIDNKRTAFFLDGDEIILATEGMTVKGRWRLVRINPETVTLEDTQSKRQQPLAISEEAGGPGGPGGGSE